ncbi:MAG: DNA mismatch repair endonuclease MutL [Planctomycetes bacterium]|nr:DNA mismatch repair endonuclease MutL [Planctomycetota bacterium]
MGTIKILPEVVQNKIAAGEVIERPASVVKELAENAMDAGATLVAVELEEGGHRLIRVSDDGRGMDETDLVACMQRHATSKISEVEDIFRIATFGFRGEALPSIGSVSRLRIVSSPARSSESHELVVEAGRLVRITPAAPRKGTRVEVRDIFFNTPARRKFLSRPASENTRAAEILTRLALGNPGVGFRLQTDTRMVLSLKPAASLADRVGDLFGPDTAGKLVPFAADIAEGLAVSGFFARPPVSRRTGRDIYILVNRRWIRHYGLSKAVADAFQGVLPPREFPFAIISLTVDPSQVDVNAHPTKEEVRFSRDGIMISGVRRAMREALDGVATTPTVATFAAAPSPERAPPPRSGGTAAGRREGEGDQARFDLPTSFARSRGDLSRLDLDAARERLRGGESRPAADSTASSPAGTAAGPTAASDASAARRSGEPEADPPAAGGTPVHPLGAAGHRILGQAGGRYVLVDGPDGILLVDPHALHERWNFDRLMEARRSGGSQTRLLQLELRLSPAEAAAAVEAVPALAEYGFDIVLPEPTCLRITSAPAFIPPAKIENLIRQVLADLGDAAATVEAARERLLASLACRSSVLLGRTLPEEEIVALLDRFFHQGQLPTCPHGRPTAIRIGWEELARRFGR